MASRKSNEYLVRISVALPGPNPEHLWTLLLAEDEDYEARVYVRPSEGAPMPVLSISYGMLRLQLDPDVESWLMVGPLSGSSMRTGITFSNAEGHHTLDSSRTYDTLRIRLPEGQWIEVCDFVMVGKTARGVPVTNLPW